MHAILKFFFYLIENVSKVTVWNSNYMNPINNNAIEINFDNFLFKILYLFLVREFNFIDMSSVDLRTHSLCMKLINTYNSNRRTRFYKFVNLQYVFDWCSFIWLVYKNVHLQLCDDSRCQFIWCCIIKIVNDVQNHIEFDKINIFENNFRSIWKIRLENVEHRKFFYRTNIMNKRARLT